MVRDEVQTATVGGIVDGAHGFEEMLAMGDDD